MEAEQRGVVVHLNDADADKQASVLRNVVNLRAELGAHIPVEVVVHGPAVTLLVGGNDAGRQVHELLTGGVRFAACANSLRTQQLDRSAVLDGVQIVPAGVAHLARRQFDGWAYLRP